MSSITASEWFRTDYMDGVLQKYQDQGGRLLNTCRKKSITDAKDAQFHVIGMLEAYAYDGKGELKEQGAEHSTVKVEPKTYKVTPTIEGFDLDRMAEDDRDEHHKQGALALGRQADDLIYDAAITSATGSVLGGAGQFFTPDFSQKLQEELFEARNVSEDEDIFCIINRRMWRHLMRYDDFKSSDYVGPDIPLTKNAKFARTWGGMNYICFNRTAAGASADLKRGVVYPKSALGHVSLKELSVIMTWENKKNHWFINMGMDMAAKGLLPEGIVKFDIDMTIDPESWNPATNSPMA